jgi:FtsP/CotA-like multicopper oxidase with cupredoxin domain
VADDWSRRKFLQIAGLVAGGTLLQACTAPVQSMLNTTGVKIGGGHDAGMHEATHGTATVVPVTGHATPRKYGGFDPTTYLTQFDTGKVTGTTADGRTIREFNLVSEDKEIEVIPGVKYAAWTFNGTVPGPTFRCTEGDLVRIHFTNNGDHPHSLHLHGIHPASADGLAAVAKGGRFTYELIAEPFGVFPFHCHVMPLRKHIAKGLYGQLIVDPKVGRPPATEMVMVMNGFDVDFDDVNDLYTVNGVAFHYQNYPIQVKLGEPLRIYLINMTEYDLINSYHQHANMFQYYPNGTSLTPAVFTDTVTLGQGERGIMEMAFKYPGKYMFHAHVSEFAELGWIGFFEVT